MTAAVCGCGHPHLAEQTLCFICELPVPTIVPPALSCAPQGSAGGTQATCICGRTVAACAEAGRKAVRQ